MDELEGTVSLSASEKPQIQSDRWDLKTSVASDSSITSDVRNGINKTNEDDILEVKKNEHAVGDVDVSACHLKIHGGIVESNLTSNSSLTSKYSDVARSHPAERESTERPPVHRESGISGGKSLAQNLSKAFFTAMSSLNPFASLSEESCREYYEVSWDIALRPGIVKDGQKLMICTENPTNRDYFPLTLTPCHQRAKIQEASGAAKIPVTESKTIRYSFVVADGNEKRFLEEQAREIYIMSPAPIEIPDDALIFKKTGDGLQDLFYHRLNKLLKSRTADLQQSISSMIAHLDLMLSIQVVSKRSRTVAEGTFCEERFGSKVRADIRRVVSEWCVINMIDCHASDEKMAICLFVCAIFGYFGISATEITKSLQSSRLFLVHQCIEATFGPATQAHKQIQALDPKSKVLILHSITVVCATMVSNKFYGWIGLLYLLDLDSPDSIRIFETVPNSSMSNQRDDTRNFHDAMTRSNLERGQQGVYLALKHVPSVVALLKDPILTSLVCHADIAARLTSFILSSGRRTELFEESLSVILEWLTFISSDLHLDSKGAQNFNALLSALFSATLHLRYKVAYMSRVARILAHASSGQPTKQSDPNWRDVLVSSLLIIGDFIGHAPRPASNMSKHEIDAELQKIWSPAFEVEEAFEEAVAGSSHSSRLGYLFRSWISNVQDREYIVLFPYILEKERDRVGHSSVQSSGSSLSARLHRCL